MKYTVALEPQEEGGFTVRCVDLPGAISEGETREEALANIREAMELLLQIQREEIHKKYQIRGCEIFQIEVPGGA